MYCISNQTDRMYMAPDKRSQMQATTVKCPCKNKQGKTSGMQARSFTFSPGNDILLLQTDKSAGETRREQERKENMALLLGIVSVLLGVAMLLIYKNTL